MAEENKQAEDPLLRAQLDFTPVPLRQRNSPGRVKSVPARLYINRYKEHKEAFQFLQTSASLHGEGGKTLVRALLHYKNTVLDPLEAARKKNENTARPEWMIALLDFEPLQSNSKGQVKNVSARLYIDRYIEHREAYHFLQKMQDLHGEGNKTIVRALIHYRDTVFLPLQELRKKK